MGKKGEFYTKKDKKSKIFKEWGGKNAEITRKWVKNLQDGFTKVRLG